MNNITDEQIMKILNEQKSFLDTIYDEKQILGIFTYGRVNYGFARTIDDIKTLVIYLPTFSELCNIEPNLLEKVDIPYKNNKVIKKIDIRGLYNFATLHDGVLMETLSSEYRIINPIYKKIFTKYFLLNKELIFRCNPTKKVETIVTAGIKALNKYEEDNTDIDSIFKASYLRIAGRLYLDGVSSENCINLRQDYYKNYLWQILNGEIVPDLQEVRSELELLLREVYEQDLVPNTKIKEIIDEGSSEIIKVSLTDIVQTETFMNKITVLEKQAFDIILNHLSNEYEGFVSISQLVEESDISRPVFKSILNKMQKNLIAELENKGAKGTYIKIIDSNILKQIDNK